MPQPTTTDTPVKNTGSSVTDRWLKDDALLGLPKWLRNDVTVLLLELESQTRKNVTSRYALGLLDRLLESVNQFSTDTESSDESDPRPSLAEGPSKTERDSINRPMRDNNPVNHPQHYTQHPSGIETIQVTEWFNFNRGNAIKYIWRADGKGDTVEDLKKARWYLDREIDRVSKLRPR